jgi:Fe-S-cluster-containing hydrogenase component 2
MRSSYSLLCANGAVIQVSHAEMHGTQLCGYCVECGTAVPGGKVTVRRAWCAVCERHSVYAAQELLLAGLLR